MREAICYRSSIGVLAWTSSCQENSMICPSCQASMKMTSESEETFGLPATPIRADYECPNCGKKYRYDRQRYAIAEI
jgi:hypothetical protein